MDQTPSNYMKDKACKYLTKTCFPVLFRVELGNFMSKQRKNRSVIQASFIPLSHKDLALMKILR